MLLHLQNVLTAEELRTARAALASASWIDGRSTAGQQAVSAKNNQQLPQDGDTSRSLQALVLGAKARALTMGRAFVTPEDIRTLAAPVFRHRVLINFQAESEGLTTDAVVARLLETITPPASGLA